MAAIEKHTPFFNLVDAVNSGECPACFRVNLRINQFFQTLLYQNVNNRGLRAELRANSGFCAPHAHRLGTYKDGLAVAIMHLELLESAEKNNGVPRIPTYRQTRNNGTVPDCPACRIASDEAATTLNLLSQYGDDPQFIEAYGASEGLCLPHFRRLLEQDKTPPQIIINRQREQLQALIAQTGKFIDGENVTSRARPELSREDRLVWKTIIDRYYGKPGSLG